MTGVLTLAAGLGRFLPRLAVLAALALAFAELMARAGAAPAALIGRRRPGGPGAALDRFGLGLLLGLFALGTAYLGLALTGLLRPPAVAGTALLLVAASRRAWRPASPLAMAARELGMALGPRWGAAILAALLPFTALWVVPDTEQDSLVYHLGFPWQCLRIGKTPLDYTSLAFHIGLPVDLVHALPLAFGDDRPCKWISLSWFAGAAAVFAAAQLRRGWPLAIPCFALLFVASPNVHPNITNAKNDLAAGALLLAGAWRQLGGRWTSGALLLGCATAAKFVLWPVAALWTLVLFPPREVRWRCAALMALASLPWWGKAWLAVGNPLFPFGTDRIPTLGWGPINRAVFTAGQRQLALPEAMSWTSMPRGWLKQMGYLYLPLLVCLPGALLLPSRLRRGAVAAAAGTYLILGLGRIARYMLPPAAVLASVAAAGVGRIGGPAGDRARVLLLVYALSYAWYPQLKHPVARMAFLPAAQAYQEGFTTFADALRLLAPLHPKRFFQIGEVRTHRMPGRVCYDATSGETPFPWKVAHESADVPSMAVRWRQMGARVLFYNYVTVEWQSITHWRFEWKDEALRRHVDFCKRHLSIISRTETSDYLNGGFYLFAIARRPDPKPPKTIWFAPGTENLYGMGIILHNGGNPQASLNHYLSVRAILPDVGMAWNLVGHAYSTMNIPDKAFEALHPFAAQGMIDALNLGEYGGAAMRSGRLDAAGPILTKCLEVYPGHRNVIRVNLGALAGAKSIEALRKSNPAAALKLLDEGEAHLALVPKGPDPKEANETARRQTLAMLYGIRGEMAFAENAPPMALRYLKMAVAEAPDSRGVDRWKQIIAALEPRPFAGP